MPAGACLAFIRDYGMPDTCTDADLTLTGCIEFLDRQSRLYREQVKGLIARCDAGDTGLCGAAETELTDLRDALASAEARAAGLADELEAQRGQNAALLARTETAAPTGGADPVDPRDVCRAAALRLTARAAEAGAEPPALDETACAANPIAEVTRVLALLSAAGPATADAAPVDGAAPVDPPAAVPPESAAAACVALPTDGDLGFFLIEQDAIFGSLGPVRQNVLINSLLKGEPAIEAVEKAWPKPLDEAERAIADEGARLLCQVYPATCPQESGVEVCR